MRHDTAKFWDVFEDIKEPIEISPELVEKIRSRHKRMRLISIRLPEELLRIAKARAKKNHIPYQVLIRSYIEESLLLSGTKSK